MKKGRLEEAIELARKQGHHIKVRKRADGGYRITEIDGVKYTGSSGNNAIRSMTGTGGLTRKQQSSLKKNRKKVTKALSNEEKKVFKKINKARKKAGLKAIKQVKARKVKKRSKKQFIEMISRMKHSVLKKIGFAEYKNVQAFIAQLERFRTTPNSVGETYHFVKTINFLMRNMMTIKDSALMEAYQIAYQWQKGYIDGASADDEMVAVLKAGTKELMDIAKAYEEAKEI